MSDPPQMPNMNQAHSAIQICIAILLWEPSAGKIAIVTAIVAAIATIVNMGPDTMGNWPKYGLATVAVC